MAGHRWMKFWPQDWLRDPALRCCGPAARGLWIDMICLMHDGRPYGHLTINGKPATMRQLSILTGTSEIEVSDLMSELEEAGVFSRGKKGVIFSRRMVSDYATSSEGREHIAKRWGKGGKSEDADNVEDTPISLPNSTDDENGDSPPNTKDTESDIRDKKESVRQRASPVVSADDEDAGASQPKAAPKRGTRLPVNWKPGPELMDYCRSLGVDPDKAAEEFCTFWPARAGREALKLDWPLTFMGRCRDLAERKRFPLSIRDQARANPGRSTGGGLF